MCTIAVYKRLKFPTNIFFSLYMYIYSVDEILI